jgi:outer membrane receptor protein involved in Fe transport
MLSAGAFVFASPALAQPTQDTVPTQESPTEEGAVQQSDTTQAPEEGVIIVTAQGRAQALQDVPLAVSAINQEQLQNSGATDIRALNQLAPSLLVSSTGSEANGSARIRGIGTVGDNPGLESSVAVFIDGVYRSRSGIGLNELGEIERIEVLRGPQGTLFGRNASAGIIHVITRRPQFTFGGMAELSYGNYNAIRAQGAITGPLSDTIAFRLDAIYNRRDGFLEVVNPTGGTEDRVNDRNRVFARGQLLFQPNDALSIRLVGDYTWRDESCCGAVYYDTREAIDPSPGVAGDFAYSPTNRIVTILQRQGGVLPSNGDPFNRLIAISPGRTYQNETTDYGVSAHIEYDFGNVSLNSITAYRGYKAGGAGDFDYGSVDIVYGADNDLAYREFKTLTQELRLNGTAFNGALDWLVGAYFANEDLTVSSNVKFGTQYGPFAACRAAAGAAQTVPLLPFLDPTQPACLSPTGRAATLGQLPGTTPAFGPFTPGILSMLDRLSTLRDLGDNQALYEQNSQNYAFFTHNIFNITDRLSLTLGLRYTNEGKDFSAQFNNNNTICPAQQAAGGGLLQAIATAPGLPAATRAALSTAVGQIVILTCTGNSSSGLNALNLNDSIDDGELSGTAVVTFRPSAGNLFYGSYSRGFKAGGYNLDRSDLGSAVFPRTAADVVNLRFAPEIVDAFELGAKITRSMFSLNAAVFHQRFRDFQLNTFNGLVFIVQNINGCTDLIGGSGADSDGSPTTGTCSPDNISSGVTSSGIELEAVLRPTEDFTVTAGYTYTNTSYEEDLVGSNTGEALDPALFLLPGDNLSNAPEHVTTMSLAYTPRIGNSGITGLFYLDARMTSDYNTGSDLFPEKEQEGYLVVNGRIGIRGPDQRWALEIWAQNLLDEDYTQVAFNLPFQGAGTRAQVQRLGAPSSQTLFGAYLAEPRTFGVTGRFRF